MDTTAKPPQQLGQAVREFLSAYADANHNGCVILGPRDLANLEQIIQLHEDLETHLLNYLFIGGPLHSEGVQMSKRLPIYQAHDQPGPLSVGQDPDQTVPIINYRWSKTVWGREIYVVEGMTDETVDLHLARIERGESPFPPDHNFDQPFGSS